MTEIRSGRLLAACLHQAIGDVLPDRLEFYENWLDGESLRDGSIGPAPLTAVIGFLRTEGAAYEAVVTRAGQLAAQWSIASTSSMRRRAIELLPRWLRVRAATSLAAEIIRSVSLSGKASARIRRGRARVELQASIFCAVREAQAAPLCGFYVAVAVETLAHFGISASGRIDQCRAVRGAAGRSGTCILALDLASGASEMGPAVAA